MQIKKQQQTIIMITIVAIVMIGFALFAKESIVRHKEVRGNEYPINQSSATTTSSKDIQTSTMTTNVPENIASSTSTSSLEDGFDGEVIYLGNGWKKFFNRDVGLEFNILDRENKIIIKSRFSEINNKSGSGSIVVENPGRKDFLEIDFYTNEKYSAKGLRDFKAYLADHPMFNFGELFVQTITEKYNDNNVKYYEVLTDQLSDRYPGMKEQTRQTTKNYVIEYKNDENDSGNQEGKYVYYQYFTLNGSPEFMDEVIKSFRFIN